MKGKNMSISKDTAIEKLKHDCIAKDQIFSLSVSSKEKNLYGECYITDLYFTEFFYKGSIEGILKERNLLPPGETLRV